MLSPKRLSEIVSKAKFAFNRACRLENQWAARLAYIGDTYPIIKHPDGTYTTGPANPKGTFSEEPEWVQAALPMTQFGQKSNAMTREFLPEVTPAEHAEIVKDYPELAPWTRPVGAGRDQWMDFSPFTYSKPPVIKEVWVGARSMNCAVDYIEETYDVAASQFVLRARRQEDAAELSELQDQLYHDAKTGKMMMTDPDTGKWRPIRNGDTIMIVRGSNDDLDALFGEEDGDPRVQSDHEAYGEEHKFTERFRANNYLEETYLQGNCSVTTDYRNPIPEFGPNIYASPRSYERPNSAMPEGTRWEPDDLTLRHTAHEMAEQIRRMEPRKKGVPITPFMDLVEAAYAELIRMVKDFRIEENVIVQGHMVSRDEFFGTLEANRLEYDEATLRYEKDAKGKPLHRDYAGPLRKAWPKAMDWDAIRESK